VGSEAEALGLLYVTEGATLGGRTILRSLAAQGVNLRGLAFLDPYGGQTGAMWMRFRSVLSQSLGTDEIRISGAVRGALRGFAFAELCLCDSRVPA
jgi:heme oxygenase